MECVQNTDVKRKRYTVGCGTKKHADLSACTIKIQNDVIFFSEDNCAGQILNLFC